MKVDEIYNEFVKYLDNENKEEATSFIIDKLNNQEIDIVTLHTKILAPALNNMYCNLEERGICIWKEHVRSSIIRTIIECAYPYVIKERDRKAIRKNGKRVILVCPTEEYHEMGARIGADFFTLCGYDTVFVGSNTPKADFIEAINFVKPDYIVVSVTNFYNLVAAKKAVDSIRAKNKDVKILASGYAFKGDRDNYKKIGADMFIDSYEDIFSLDRGDIL